MRKSHSVVVITLRARLCNWSLIVKIGRLSPYPLASHIGHHRSFGWIHNNGRRRRILSQTKCGDVQAVYAFLDSTSSVFDCFSADGLVAQLVSPCAAHRGGICGIAMRQLPCSASASGPRTRFTSLGQDWSQNTMSVHVQGMSRNDVPLWSECPRA